jgi:hypothetical protein
MKPPSNSIRMLVNGEEVRAGACWAHFAREIPNDADLYELTVSEEDIRRTPGPSQSASAFAAGAKPSDHWVNSIFNLDSDCSIDALKWVIVCVDTARVESDSIIIKGRCRPFREKY